MLLFSFFSFLFPIPNFMIKIVCLHVDIWLSFLSCFGFVFPFNCNLIPMPNIFQFFGFFLDCFGLRCRYNVPLWGVKLSQFERDISGFSRQENDSTDLLNRSWNSKGAVPSETEGGEMGKLIENHSAAKEPSKANTLKLDVEWVLSFKLVLLYVNFPSS